MENTMFCFQCQEAAKGTGCTMRGVCGKLPQTSTYIDLLLSAVRGVGTIDHLLHLQGVKNDNHVHDFIVDALFATISCANFDDESLLRKVDNGVAIKKELVKKAQDNHIVLPKWQEVVWNGSRDDYQAEGEREASCATPTLTCVP